MITISFRYMYPLLVLLHACLAGYIYYTFAYVTLGVAVVGNVLAMTNVGRDTACGELWVINRYFVRFCYDDRLFATRSFMVRACSIDLFDNCS